MGTWSIKRRLIGSLVASVAVLWIIGVIIAGLVVRYEVVEVFDSALRETAGHLVPVALDVHRRKVAALSGQPLLEPAAYVSTRGQVHYVLRDRGGTVLISSKGAPDDPKDVPLKSGFYDHGHSRYFGRFLHNEGLWIHVAQEFEERQEAATGLWLGLASPLLALLAITALVVWRTVGRAAEPILRVSNGLAARGVNDLQPIDDHGLPSELTPVVDSVNLLMRRLKAALDSERAFAANAAHELRNPIAAARVQIQLLADHLRDTPESARADNVVSQLGRLGRRIEKLLQMARAEASLGHVRERSDLVAITCLVVEDFQHQPDVGARLKLEMEGDGDCWVGMDQDAIGIVLRNAIENAVHHGISTEPIEIRLRRDHTLRIVNACQPMPDHVRSTLTDRFRRGAVRQAAGNGLGLTIMDMLMRQAGGSVTLSPGGERGEYFEVVLRFPGDLTGA